MSGRECLRTKVHREILIRRHIDVIRQLLTELGLVLSVTLVHSPENRADTLDRISEDWMLSDTLVAGAAAIG